MPMFTRVLLVSFERLLLYAQEALSAQPRIVGETLSPHGMFPCKVEAV